MEWLVQKLKDEHNNTYFNKSSCLTKLSLSNAIFSVNLKAALSNRIKRLKSCYIPQSDQFGLPLYFLWNTKAIQTILHQIKKLQIQIIIQIRFRYRNLIHTWPSPSFRLSAENGAARCKTWIPPDFPVTSPTFLLKPPSP